MITAASPSRVLARRLLALEAAKGPNTPGGRGRAVHAESTARVCEKLRATLTAFAGAAGFRSLLSRALTLAAAQAPELKDVTVLEDGSLWGIENVESGKKNAEAQEWDQVLVAQLLDLLVTFVGEGLMHQLVRQAWPNLPGGPLRSRTEHKS